jgi:SNF2 family DNA or RNA helicase
MEAKDAVKRENTFRKFQVILGTVLLRRAKSDKLGAHPIIDLPPRNVNVVELNFNKDERMFYLGVEKNAITSLERFASDGGIMVNYMNILTLLLRLRQACSHPSLCQWSKNAGFVFTESELDAVERSQGQYKALPDAVKARLMVELAPDSAVVHARCA